MKVISVSPRKNTQQAVYHNTGPDGKTHSITRHIPLNEAKPVYRRFGIKPREAR